MSWRAVSYCFVSMLSSLGRKETSPKDLVLWIRFGLEWTAVLIILLVLFLVDRIEINENRYEERSHAITTYYLPIGLLKPFHIQEASKKEVIR